MNTKIISGLFVLALAATACVSEFNAKLPPNDAQLLIVEGNIMENTDAVFYLSKSFPLDSALNKMESLNVHANVTIIGSNGYQSQPATNVGYGAYRIAVGSLDDDVAYGVRIEYDGNTYQSALTKPLRTPEIDSISFIQTEKGGMVDFQISTHDNKNGANFFIWNYKEDWEISAYYATTIFYNPVDSIFYTDYSLSNLYCWRSSASNQFLIGSTESLKENSIINQQLYQLAPQDARFSLLYCVTVNQRAISKGAYEYYQNKITLNGEMGGLFTPQPTELTGNVTCTTDPSKRVMGYIEVNKNTTQKRIFVYPWQITRPPMYPDCTTITQDSVRTLMSDMKMSYTDVYNMGLRPAGDMDMMQYPRILPTDWAMARCTDCVSAGGSKNKPDFWPNDHK